MTTLRLARGTLWPAIVARTRAALASGALAPIETEERCLEQSGLRFRVRLATTLAAKPIATRHTGPGCGGARNPFLPPDPELVVADVTDTHVAVLNKFPVIAHHLLVVTRAFAPQTAPLDHDDVVALLACLGEYPGLAFYNGGEQAGASQPHKHLQVVPLAFTAGAPLPFAGDLAPLHGQLARVPQFDFAHAVAMLPPGCVADPEAAAEEVLALCRAALDTAVGAGPYNLLCTVDRLLVVARSTERHDGVSVNALGFAGSLFAKDANEFAVLASARPLEVLKAVSRGLAPAAEAPLPPG